MIDHSDLTGAEVYAARPGLDATARDIIRTLTAEIRRLTRENHELRQELTRSSLRAWIAAQQEAKA